MRSFYLFCLILLSSSSFAQESVWETPPEIKFGGYIETYYSYDLNQAANAKRQPYFFNYNRHNQFNLNLGILRFDLKHPRYRGAFALQAGTYVNDNYINEASSLKNIHEAHVGIALDKKSRFWIEMGILPSYIGCESAMGMDNPTLTRSLVAENSPYFMSGAQVSYESEKWTAAIILNNGWQRITRVPKTSAPGVGSQVQYHPSKRLTLNWSSFSGSDFPDSLHRNRYFQNFYLQGKLGKKSSITLGFDYGLETSGVNEISNKEWLGYLFIFHHQFNSRYAAALRLEQFNDPRYAVVSQAAAGAFRASGASLNFDYQPIKSFMLRLEARYLQSENALFWKQQSFAKNTLNFTFSLSYKIP